MTDERRPEDRAERREVILSRVPARRVGRSAVLRSSLAVVYARAVRTIPDPPALGE